MKGLEEENPALGWRAIRIGLDRPALLRIQMRAMLRAAAGRDLRVMLPMVSTVERIHRRARPARQRRSPSPSAAGAQPPRSVAVRR